MARSAHGSSQISSRLSARHGAACERTLVTIEQCPDLRVRLPLLRAELQIAIAKAKVDT
jgi:hypothetical protein